MRRFFVAPTSAECGLREQVANQSSSRQNAFTALQMRSAGDVMTLPDGVYNHWCRVLRGRIGDQGVLFDGLGGERIVTLHTVDKKQATAKLHEHLHEDRISTGFFTVAIVMSRGDRMDYAIQKATELGATVIQLLTSHHGEVRLKAHQIDKKLAHWQQVALSACEQCGLNRPPLVLSPLSIESWLQGEYGYCNHLVNELWHDSHYQSYLQAPILKLVLAVPPEGDISSHDAPNSDASRSNRTTHHTAMSLSTANQCHDDLEDICQIIQAHKSEYKLEDTAMKPRFDLLIGAEGGLSDDEYAQARQQGYLPWQIGNRVLRTETAPVVALSLLNFIN